MKVKYLLASTMIPLLLVLPRHGLTGNGIEVYQFDYSDTETHPYVECLGEGIDHELVITVRTHTVERSNGGVHIVQNWFIEGYSFGKVSGKMWYTRNAVGPWVTNEFGDGQLVDGWTLEMLWKPLDGGRQFHEKGRYRVVYGADGVPRVEHIPDDYRMQCTGR